MVIFIAGPLNAGKSTVAEELKSHIKKCVVLEPDIFHKLIENVPIDKAVPTILEMTSETIKILNGKNFNIIAPYPLSNRNHEYLNACLRGIKKYFFILSPDMKAIASGRGKRRLNDWERKRILHHYKIGIHNPSFGYKIDNTLKTPKETAKLILRIVKNK